MLCILGTAGKAVSSASITMNRRTTIFERLVDTDVKAELLTLFHDNPQLEGTATELARRLGRNPSEIQQALDDLVELGLLNEEKSYSFGVQRDRELRDEIAKQVGVEKKPQRLTSVTERLQSDLELLHKVLPDGLAYGSTILVLSDPGAAEEKLLAHYVSKQIQSGKTIAYLTLDAFPANIRQIVQAQSDRALDWSHVVFIDCYSMTVGEESKEPYVVDPENLSAISIAITDIMTKKEISMMVIDSLNTLIRKRGVRSSIELLRVLVARARQAGCLSFASMNRKAFHPAIAASAQDIVDGVIELKVEERGDRIVRSLRVLKMVGLEHMNRWVPYTISANGELVEERI
jgi:KaiC/GvpD/RAD55 family RecA-like ATPase